MNPYLKAKREAYTSVANAIEGIQTRAAGEDRDLTEDELRSVKDQSELAKKIHAEIELLTEQENRSADVAELGTKLRTEVQASGVTANDRDPGHYRSEEQGGTNSFFGDLYKAKVLHDDVAQNRIVEHSRAQNTAGVAGVVPPQWLVDQFTVINQQDAVLYDNVSKYAINDARVIQLPGQTVSTVIATQAAENNPLVASDAYDAATVNITPTTLVGKETVSRQLLDAGQPGIDALILADLTAVYVAQRENRIGAAIRAVGTTVGGTIAQFRDNTNANFGYDLAVDAAMAVRKAHFRRPTFYAMDYDTFSEYLKLADANGRPIIVGAASGPQNAGGVANLTADGWIAGIPVIVSAGLEDPAAVTDLRASMVHGPSVINFESPQMTFRFEEVQGPESIQLGLWRYHAVAVRQETRALKNVRATLV